VAGDVWKCNSGWRNIICCSTSCSNKHLNRHIFDILTAAVCCHMILQLNSTAFQCRIVPKGVGIFPTIWLKVVLASGYLTISTFYPLITSSSRLKYHSSTHKQIPQLQTRNQEIEGVSCDPLGCDRLCNIFWSKCHMASNEGRGAKSPFPDLTASTYICHCCYFEKDFLFFFFISSRIHMSFKFPKKKYVHWMISVIGLEL